MLKDLETNSEPIGALFLRRADLFKIYAVYCSNQPRITKTIRLLNKNPKFLHLVEKANKNPRCQLMRLEDFLILPMQRITRYPMLLSSLQSSLDDGDAEKADLEQAAFKIKTITTLINERTRQVESIERLVEIQQKIVGGEALGLVAPSRTCLYEGRLRFKKMLTSNLDNPWAFLFSDMLMLCSKDQSEDIYIVKKIIPFESSSAVTISDLESETDNESIEITCQSSAANGKQATSPKQYKVKAFGKAEKQKWLKQLRAIQDRSLADQNGSTSDSTSAAEVKATVKRKLGSLRSIPAGDPRGVSTWRETRSLSRPNLDAIVSPREAGKLEKTHSAKSLAVSPQPQVPAPGSEKLVRRPASRELASESPDRERIRTHTRERSSTYGGPPPLSVLSDESLRELAALDSVSQNNSEPTFSGKLPKKAESASSADPPSDPRAIPSRGGERNAMSDEAQPKFSSSPPTGVAFMAGIAPNETGTSSNPGSPNASLSKRSSKAKLNLRAISQFAASVIRGKKKEDARVVKTDSQPTLAIDSPQTARAVLMTDDAPKATEPEAPSSPALDPAKSSIRNSRGRKNAVIDAPTSYLPSRLESATMVAESEELLRPVSPDDISSPKDIGSQLAIFSQALLDVFGVISVVDTKNEDNRLVLKAAKSPAVKHALELLKRSASDENMVLITSILSKIPPSRKSGQFSRTDGQTKNRSSTELNSRESAEIPVRSSDFVAGSPRHSHSTPGIVVHSPRIVRAKPEDENTV